MYEYIAVLGICLLLLFIFIKNQKLTSRFFGKFLRGNNKKKRSKVYLEHFREYKHRSSSGNIIFQILPLLGVLAFAFILSNQYIYFGTVLSGSMEPHFKKGDLVLMQKVDKDPKIGDIIMFGIRGNKEPIIHRISMITAEGGIITKGDNNPAEDSWILTKINIIGKAVIIGNSPVTIKGLGATFVPEAKNFTIMRKLTSDAGTTMFLQRFRGMQPIIIFSVVIFYLFILMETRREEEQRFNRKDKNVVTNRKIKSLK
jgi:signal peptidase I